MTQRFMVKRDDLRQARVGSGPDIPLAAGQARLRVDGFSLTSNNITYGAFGESMHYWDFFPTGEAGWGCIPVWGFADVVESTVAGVEVGERFYGYWPMSDSAVLQPVRVDERGFVDGAPHRQALHALYNRYTRCSADPGYRPDREAQIALLRPLFATSFLIDDFVAQNECFGAAQLLMSSASSKTASGTAFLLSRRRTVKTVGLTSARNLSYTKGLGCYDDVLDYDSLATLAAETPTVYVDFSGNARLRAEIHARFGERLKYSCSVGGTHWSELGGGKGLPGPQPILFFAPEQAKRRSLEWGSAVLQQRIADAWEAFMQPVNDPARRWLTVVRRHGAADVEAAYRALLDGRSDPSEGYVLAL